jgi:hypothetical protein
MSNLHILNFLYAASFLAGALIVRKTLTAPALLVSVDQARLQSLALFTASKLR